MLSLLLGIMLFIQPTDTTTTSDILIIHDSIETSQFKRIHLSNFEGWRYHPGDNLSWANPEFDDSNWTRLSSAQDVPDSLWTGIGWWRIKFKADSSMVDKVLGFNVLSRGAAELYFDGKLVNSVGKPSTNPEEQKLIYSQDPTGYLTEVEANKTYTLALRYSFHNFF